MVSHKRTGAFLITGLILFSIGLFFISNRRGLFNRTFDLYAEFTHLNGLQKGVAVQISGMDAGVVLETQAPDRPDGKFRVKLRIPEKLHPLVRTDSVATIKATGLSGNTFIEVEKGTGRAPESADGSTLPSQEPMNLADILQQGTDLIKTTRGSIEDLRGNADRALQSAASAANHTDQLIVGMSGNLREIAASGKRTGNNVNEIVAQIKKGQGTVGQLLTDQNLASELDDTVANARQSSINLNQASGRANDTIADFQARNLLGQAQAILENTRQITRQLNGAVNDFVTNGQKSGSAAATLRQTIASAQQSMSNLADDTEALKHNFFLRGFFNKRGFFNLNQMTPAQYRSSKFLKGHSSERVWLNGNDLFLTKPDGTEELSVAGQQKLNEALSAFVAYLPNSAIMVEGYSTQGQPSEQFRLAGQHAAEVRNYLEERFNLNPKLIGIMPMSEIPPAGTGKTVWDGVALVLIR
ncbi:MAG: MlaD family protein [Bryobacteraceae bacterium]